MSEEGNDDNASERKGPEKSPDALPSHAHARDLESDMARLEQARAFAQQAGLGEPYFDEEGQLQHRIDPRSKFTDAVAEKILSAIRIGSFRKPACLAAGITPQTLRNWEAQAKAGREPFFSFWERMAMAEAQAEVNTLGVIVAASRGQLPKIQEREGEHDPEEEEDEKVPGKKRRRHKNAQATSKYDWHAAAFILERRGPRRWAQKQSVDIRGGTTGPGGSTRGDGPAVSIALPPERDE